MANKFALTAFDEAVRGALRSGQNIAAHRGHARVDLPHFVLGSIKSSGVALALSDAGIDLNHLRACITELLADVETTESDKPFVSKELLRVLQRAQSRMAKDGKCGLGVVYQEVLSTDGPTQLLLSRVGCTWQMFSNVTATLSWDERLDLEAAAALRAARILSVSRKHRCTTPAHLVVAARQSHPDLITDELLTSANAKLAAENEVELATGELTSEMQVIGDCVVGDVIDLEVLLRSIAANCAWARGTSVARISSWFASVRDKLDSSGRVVDEDLLHLLRINFGIDGDIVIELPRPEPDFPTRFADHYGLEVPAELATLYECCDGMKIRTAGGQHGYTIIPTSQQIWEEGESFMLEPMLSWADEIDSYGYPDRYFPVGFDSSPQEEPGAVLSLSDGAVRRFDLDEAAEAELPVLSPNLASWLERLALSAYNLRACLA